LYPLALRSRCCPALILTRATFPLRFGPSIGDRAVLAETKSCPKAGRASRKVLFTRWSSTKDLFRSCASSSSCSDFSERQSAELITSVGTPGHDSRVREAMRRVREMKAGPLQPAYVALYRPLAAIWSAKLQSIFDEAADAANRYLEINASGRRQQVTLRSTLPVRRPRSPWPSAVGLPTECYRTSERARVPARMAGASWIPLRRKCPAVPDSTVTSNLAIHSPNHRSFLRAHLDNDFVTRPAQANPFVSRDFDRYKYSWLTKVRVLGSFQVKIGC